ncbi:LAG1 longevity assurance homolog 2 [Striga asiatica]|uniref:LAG1 longevity assurance homolog 2 n=1 Tax=Striga asiatica TaxID=4170 RepID=A0A5A7QB33_STRAF|nr:LAG1 longevity assurance homolog 2 [Striga asiatica]
MESIWNSGGEPSAWHFIVAVYFAFGFVTVRFFLDRCVFRKLAIWLLSRRKTLLKHDKKTSEKIVKCSESLWKLTYYGTIEFCVLITAYREPWFNDVKQYFRDLLDQELKLPLKLIYMCQCGFYMYGIAALLVWETRRKDFSVMMSHHIVTLILIAFSYLTRFFRIGAVILALHDASDIFMEAAKTFKYAEIEIGASVSFGLFALSWLVLRLIYFPFWVIRASSYHSCEVINMSDPYYWGLYYVFNTMLFTLLGFHIYWWKLICAMIIKQLKSKGKVGEDIRSDSEDDD